MSREGAFLGLPWSACLGPFVSSWCLRGSPPQMPYLCLSLCFTTGALVGCVAPLRPTRGLSTCAPESNGWEDNVALGCTLVIDMDPSGPSVVLGLHVGDLSAATRAEPCTVPPSWHDAMQATRARSAWLNGLLAGNVLKIRRSVLPEDHRCSHCYAVVEQIAAQEARIAAGSNVGQIWYF